MIFFTSDLHLGHANIIRHCSRPFASVEEMDAAIIGTINERVAAADILWILGDFAFRGRDPAHYRERINCRTVHLLLGNHDKRGKCEAAGFSPVGGVSLGHVADISVGKRRIWLSHYAHRSWPASHRGSWHLYGHSHGKLDDDDRSRKLNALDVGVDNGGRFAPWSMDELAAVLPRDRPEAIVNRDIDRPQPIVPEWMTRTYWVDPPAGWRYGFPKLYDPLNDGLMADWLIANGYPKDAAKGAICTFTAASSGDSPCH